MRKNDSRFTHNAARLWLEKLRSVKIKNIWIEVQYYRFQNLKNTLNSSSFARETDYIFLAFLTLYVYVVN